MSNDFDIRVLTDPQERLDTVVKLGGYAFEPSPPLPDRETWDKEWMQHMTEATIIALFEGDEAVAEVASHPMTQNVRGRIVDCAGIWGVATLPQARRNGYIRRLMAELLRHERAAGKTFTTLYPFRESFYERMGYIPFPQGRLFVFAPALMRSLLNHDLPGEVTFALQKDCHAEYRAFMAQYQQQVHGLALMGDVVLNGLERKRKVWVAMARVEGEVVGVMAYTLKGDEGEFKMGVRRLYYTRPEGRYLLLEWFARHMDQAGEVRLFVPPYERPEYWYPDLSTCKVERHWPPMGRVLDVARMGGLAVGAGAFTAQVRDKLCPWNAGVWHFAGQAGKLAVTATDAAPDCTLNINALSALAYGTVDPGDFAMRGWGDPAPDVQDQMRALFPPLLPYLHEQF